MTAKLIFNHPYDVSSIIIEMQKEYSGQRTNHLQILNQYFELFGEQICKGTLYATGEQLTSNTCPFEWELIRRTLPRYNNQHYWLDWLHTHYPIVTIVEKGNSFKGIRTMVTPIHNAEWSKEVEAILTPEELFTYYILDKIENIEDLTNPKIVKWTPIDQRSLDAYISANLSLPKRYGRIDDYLNDAKKIKKLATFSEELYGIFSLPQLIKESEFGRQYLTGVNLQSVPKEVRNAALGRSYQYDLENSVFAWKLSNATEIDPTAKFPATIEYLDKKEAIRKSKVALIGFEDNKFSLAIVKQLITAIGFGAKAQNTVWTLDNGKTWKTSALSEILKDPHKRKIFLEDSWVKEFVEEQEIMNRLIYNDIKNLPGLQREELKNKRGQLSINKVIAFCYQQSERMIMNALMAASEESEILLLCHDAFYTRKPVNTVTIREILKSFNKEGKIEETKIEGWAFHEETAHKNFMSNQEFIAHNGVIPLHIINNYKKLKSLKEKRRVYKGSDEYDAGYRGEPKYDPELDPFVEELNDKN